MDFLLQTNIFLFERLFDLYLLVEHSFLVSHVWQTFDKPFKSIFNFRYQELFVFFVAIKQLDYSSSILSENFFFENFISILGKPQTLFKFAILFLHLFFHEI